jgi:hypothetical protein
MLAMIAGREMCSKPETEVTTIDRGVFYAGTTISVAVSIVPITTGIILWKEVTTMQSQISTVIIVTTCVTLIINSSVKKKRLM